MRAPRVKAADVRVGDHILTGYARRTWLEVTAIEVHPYAFVPYMIDTTRNRTWWRADEDVPCQRQVRA